MAPLANELGAWLRTATSRDIELVAERLASLGPEAIDAWRAAVAGRGRGAAAP
jgi:hypothetical protein